MGDEPDPVAAIPQPRPPSKVEQALAEQAAVWADEAPEELARANALQREAFLAARGYGDPPPVSGGRASPAP